MMMIIIIRLLLAIIVIGTTFVAGMIPTMIICGIVNAVRNSKDKRAIKRYERQERRERAKFIKSALR